MGMRERSFNYVLRRELSQEMTFRQSSALESQSKKQPATGLSGQRAFQVEAGESVVVQGTAR